MDMHNVGGTPGGTRTFLLGLVMLITGGYLLFDHVQVGGGFWHWNAFGGRGTSFGITLLPLLFGIGILFVNGRSFVGRFLTGAGALLILVGIIANLDIRFQQTTLVHTLIMLVLIVGGIGLIARSAMPMERQGQKRAPDTDD
ncbi:MAG TPA: hypothetical protein VNO30_23940 [Kofleriaceae bacterium]|nr:hypothetical protein [Kofleriaceae bacterium]